MFAEGNVDPQNRVSHLVAQLRRVKKAIGDELLIRIAKEQSSPTQAFHHAKSATGDYDQAMLCQRIAQLKRDYPDAFKEVFGE